MLTMHKSKKGHNSVKFAQNFTKIYPIVSSLFDVNLM